MASIRASSAFGTSGLSMSHQRRVFDIAGAAAALGEAAGRVAKRGVTGAGVGAGVGAVVVVVGAVGAVFFGAGGPDAAGRCVAAVAFDGAAGFDCNAPVSYGCVGVGVSWCSPLLHRVRTRLTMYSEEEWREHLGGGRCSLEAIS